MTENTKKRIRRGDEQLIAALEAKINAIKARAAWKKARRNPAIRHTVVAIRSIDKAMGTSNDGVQRKALDEARVTLTAWLTFSGLSSPTGRRPRRARAAGETSGDGSVSPRRRGRAGAAG